MLDSAIYRAGLDRVEIEMGFTMECNQTLMNIIKYLIDLINFLFRRNFFR